MPLLHLKYNSPDCLVAIVAVSVVVVGVVAVVVVVVATHVHCVYSDGACETCMLIQHVCVMLWPTNPVSPCW